MVGRRLVRGSGATTLSIVALALVLALIFVPSMGPGAVPAALAAAASPAGEVVHLLGDEVVAATPSAAHDVRARALPTGDPAVATVIVLTALAAALGAGRVLAPDRTGPQAIAVRTARSGRSPPRRAVTR